MGNIQPHQKLTITELNETTNLKVIGIKDEPDGSQTYLVQTLLKDFGQSKTGGRLMFINSKEIENISIQLH